MKSRFRVLPFLFLSACATPQPATDRLAVEDFIAVRGLERVDIIRTSNSLARDKMRYVNDYHMRYQSGQRHYLIAFIFRCPNQYGTVATDVRGASNFLRARSDSIRGCRIARIYRMTKDESAQITKLGEPPGSRNPG